MSNIKSFLQEIESDVKDIKDTDFEYNSTRLVPNRSDSGLTFGKNQIKKGKVLETCVLFVDIRNSVGLTEAHQQKTMAKLYTAFTKSVIKSAKKYNGHIRNIIGDRVMVVFEVENCFTNAINCAISINHSAKIIANRFSQVDFKCGIGIDYGEMRVLKVGIQKNGTDSIEHRGLVWSGKPANLASRLTDAANKQLEEVYFEVEQRSFNPIFNLEFMGVPNAPTVNTIRLTPENFLEKIQDSDNGKLKLGFFETVLSYKKIKNKKNIPAILISEKVYKEFKKENPHRYARWKKVDYKIRNINYDVYGASLIWKID